MMRKYPYKKYLLIVGALFLLLSLPPFFSHGVRGKGFALFSPVMKRKSVDEEAKRLEGENYLLHLEIDKLRALSSYQGEEQRVVAGRVIFRDPGSWSSSLWIDVGSAHDALIQKNSPVIVGRSLVGVIDYVGKKQSRVRLITDSGLKPSVRTVRGGTTENGEDVYLAKGILQGAGTPLWRSANHTLRGIGFNYDFPDEKGPARELISSVPIIQKHDVLVTTGLDGVFPPGLSVAEVTRIFPLKEGAYTYEIEAKPLVENLDSLHTLFVISPVGYNKEDQP